MQRLFVLFIVAISLVFNSFSLQAAESKVEGQSKKKALHEKSKKAKLSQAYYSVLLWPGLEKMTPDTVHLISEYCDSETVNVTGYDETEYTCCVNELLKDPRLTDYLCALTPGELEGLLRGIMYTRIGEKSHSTLNVHAIHYFASYKAFAAVHNTLGKLIEKLDAISGGKSSFSRLVAPEFNGIALKDLFPKPPVDKSQGLVAYLATRAGYIKDAGPEALARFFLLDFVKRTPLLWSEVYHRSVVEAQSMTTEQLLLNKLINRDALSLYWLHDGLHAFYRAYYEQESAIGNFVNLRKRQPSEGELASMVVDPSAQAWAIEDFALLDKQIKERISKSEPKHLRLIIKQAEALQDRLENAIKAKEKSY